MILNRRTIIFGSTALVCIFIFALGRHLQFDVSSLKLSSPTTEQPYAGLGDDDSASLFEGTTPVVTVDTPSAAKGDTPPPKYQAGKSAAHTLHPDAQTYFDLAFSPKKPYEYDFPAIRQRCERMTWPEKEEDIVYMKCGGMAAGLTSIISQVKTCLKYAIDSGSSLVLPAMPLRDSTNLAEFNFLNEKEYYTYDQWFDADHLVEGLARACPKMKVVHPKTFDAPGGVAVKHHWSVDLGSAPGYMAFVSYFWPGRLFKPFWDEEVGKLKANATGPVPAEKANGITVVDIHAMFLVYRITDDPTRSDLRLWNDIGNLVRFLPEPREIVHELLELIPRPYYGVHFRVENDTIWSPLENQLKMNLEALDQAWAQDNKNGDPNAKKPLVYLACGDKEQVKKFQAAGAERGWEVTHKWGVAAMSPTKKDDILKRMDALAFDFQGAVDMGVMMQGNFYMGITGSAFSSTVANARDGTGRYRGSSLFIYEDGGARNHLNNDGEANGYPCCL
jgi:hypothetical protein